MNQTEHLRSFILGKVSKQQVADLFKNIDEHPPHTHSHSHRSLHLTEPAVGLFHQFF